MELDELRLPSDPERLWVKMRRKVLWGDEQAVESAIFASSNRDPLQVIHTLKRQRIFQLIEGWSLFLAADGTIAAAGTPLPMAPESLDRLEPKDGDFLYAYAKHRFEQREDVANPFVPGSPGSSPASEPPPSSETSSTSSEPSPPTP